MVKAETLGTVLGEYSDARLIVRFDSRMDGQSQAGFIMWSMETSGKKWKQVAQGWHKHVKRI